MFMSRENISLLGFVLMPDFPEYICKMISLTLKFKFEVYLILFIKQTIKLLSTNADLSLI
jgi:hypothetical protein